MDNGGSSILFLNEIKNFGGKIAVLPRIMATSADLTILNSMLSFVH